MIFWVRGHQNPPKSSKIPGFVVQLLVAEALGPSLILFLPLLIAGYKAKMLMDSAVLLGITSLLAKSIIKMAKSMAKSIQIPLLSCFLID